MKKIVFIANLKTLEDVSTIEQILNDTRVDFKVDLANKALVLEGNNDMIHAAKVALQEEGYKIN
ncbi:MAG: copper chaperone [Erysipelotrichaceae bacterium]